MIFQLEKCIKDRLFGCQHCGQCVLSHTKLICPMNCPKGLRNGPCGGTLEGMCEVIPERECVWVRIDKRAGINTKSLHLPPDRDLFETASYVNLLNGKDHETRLPQMVIDQRNRSAASELSQKMYRGEFVVTLEIASPLTRDGLVRVERVMNRVAHRVDAVNTTTNAGGVPSLHSTETARVVLDHGVEPVIQFCGRDQGEEELIQQIHQAIESGYRNFLLLTGDWLPQVAREVNQKTWFPMDSLQMIHAVNTRLTEFDSVPYIGCASNPFSSPLEVSVERLHNKRNAGARFSQTQAITNVERYAKWYAKLRSGRAQEPRLTIPSIPLIGSQRAFEVLCRLPGVYVDSSLREVMGHKDFQRRALEWAFHIAEGVTAYGAAGVHAMNFGMPAELIDEFLLQVRDRAATVRDNTWGD